MTETETICYGMLNEASCGHILHGETFFSVRVLFTSQRHCKFYSPESSGVKANAKPFLAKPLDLASQTVHFSHIENEIKNTFYNILMTTGNNEFFQPLFEVILFWHTFSRVLNPTAGLNIWTIFF